MISTRAQHLPPSQGRMAALRRPLLLLLGLAPLLSGCLVIEKKTLVLVLPPDSKEVRMYYVFEGMSVLEDERSSLPRAKTDLDSLKRPGFGFFMSAEADGSHPWFKNFRFDDLRFFVDATRKRQLCAHRRAVLLDRDKLAATINEEVGEAMRSHVLNSTDGFHEKVREANKELASKENIDMAGAFGMGALLKVIRGLAEMALKFDTPSLERIKAASNRDFQWLRFEKDTIRLVLPITRECAQKVLTDRDTVAWLKEMQTLVEPISLVARDEGLVIVVGKSPIRLTYTDPRPYRKGLDKSLFEHVGSPVPVMRHGKKASAEDLIKEFIAEAKKKS